MPETAARDLAGKLIAFLARYDPDPDPARPVTWILDG
jgi:hypothetical protein